MKKVVAYGGALVIITATSIFVPDWIMATVGCWLLAWAMGKRLGRWSVTGSFRTDRPPSPAQVRELARLRELVEDGVAQGHFTAGFLAGWNAGVSPEYQPESLEHVRMRCRADFELYRATAAAEEPRVS